MSLLTGTFERARQQRSCQLITIVGEPGVGKSRLGAELFAYIDASPSLSAGVRDAACPTARGSRFGRWGRSSRPNAASSSRTHRRRQKRSSSSRFATTTPTFTGSGHVLRPSSVRADSRPRSRNHSPPGAASASRSPPTGRRYLSSRDLHWADEGLLSFLEHLSEWTEDVPLLVLCTSRPELYDRHPGFGASARNAQRINLAPLTDTETARLIATLLEQAVLPAETQETLLARAGGNPLYAEEFVRLLADRGEPARAGMCPTRCRR